MKSLLASKMIAYSNREKPAAIKSTIDCFLLTPNPIPISPKTRACKLKRHVPSRPSIHHQQMVFQIRILPSIYRVKIYTSQVYSVFERRGAVSKAHIFTRISIDCDVKDFRDNGMHFVVPWRCGLRGVSENEFQLCLFLRVIIFDHATI